MKEFDEDLYKLKLGELKEKMESESSARKLKSCFEPGYTPYVTEIEIDIGLLRAFLEDVDRICREVRRAEGEDVTSEFIRTELSPRVLAAADHGSNTIRSRLRNLGIGFGGSEHELLLNAKIEKLTEERKRRHEIEVIEWSKRESRAISSASTKQKARKRDSKGVESRDPEVAKRRVLVRSNPDAAPNEMCQIFDRTGVPLPIEWRDDNPNLEGWVSAYGISKYAKRIGVLISKDKHRT